MKAYSLQLPELQIENSSQLSLLNVYNLKVIASLSLNMVTSDIVAWG